uniref:MADS-box protein-like protein n=1 Tax=Cymbidium goeringii TaxID=112607 RepID=A0A455LA70_9ASPA|nr:MADS-box protein-like protein [Cymbidium goeringii]
MEKKAKELFVLCDVDILFASFSPDVKVFHYWPNNFSDFHRIFDHYKSIPSNPPCLFPPPLLNSSFQEEQEDMNKKLEEIKQRICFLEEEKMAASSQQIEIIKHGIYISIIFLFINSNKGSTTIISVVFYGPDP